MKKSSLLLVGLAGVILMFGFNGVLASCDQTFYGTLRHKKQYTFGDDFSANSSDKWIQKASGVFSEQIDYNRGENPSFGRTDEIRKAKGKVSKNTTMSVIKADAAYPILDVPTSRSYNNLLVTYTITYSTDSAGNNKYTHTECKYYEISRCGDGVLDSAYETCDPKDPNKTGWGNGGCDKDCKPITVVEKDPECNSTYNDKTQYTSSSAHWLKSTDNLCSEGSVVDFSYTPSTGGPRTYTWNCQKGTNKTNPKCSAKQQWCGDGEKNGNEECDPESPDWKNRLDGKTCNSSCEIVEPSVDGTLEIEKTLVGSKEVKNVGDIVTWKIKVTAKDGDVTNFVVTDKLPGVLEYDSYKVTHNPGLTVGSPTFDGNKVIWNVTGKIKKGEYLEIELKTKVKVMPEKDYTNVACVKSEKNPEKCDEEVLPVDGKLEIEKTLVGSKEVKKVGDTVTWIIKATAAGEDVKDPIITDKLPSILGYSSSLIKSHGSTTISSEPTIDGNILTRKATGTLKKGEYIEIQLTTYAKKMPDKEYENVACVKSDKDPEKCDDEPVPAPKLWIKKYILDGDNEVKKKTVKIGDEIIYKIKFGNKGTASATITSIKDFLPKNVKYKSSEIFKISGSNSSGKVDGVEIDTYGGITLAPGVEGYIIIKGTILGENLDSTKQNWACIYLNDQKPDNSVIDEDSGVKDNPSCDYAEHEIDNGLCKKLDIPSGNIGKSGGSKTVSCTASEQVDWIEIDCGNGTKFEGSNISSLDNKTCTYPAGAKTYNLKCTVKKDGKDYTSDSCKGSVTVEGGGGGGEDPYCKAPVKNGSTFTCESTDKVYAVGIDCDHVVGKEGVDKQVKSDNGREILSVSESCNSSNKVQCYVKKDSNSGWETIADKCGWSPDSPGGGGGGGGGGGDDSIYDSVNCFNVNAGNASIQQGEVLPFYWNIEKLNDATKNGLYVEYKLSNYPYGNAGNYANILGESCTEDEDGQIALNSMVCHFAIKDGTGKVKYSDSYPCLKEKTTVITPSIVKAWADWSRDKYTIGSNGVSKQWTVETFNGTNYSFRTNVNYINNFGLNAEVFGEYKIALTKVEYAQCQDKKWRAGGVSEIECQSNFVLTNPYTVQKTPSGNLKASTTTLSKYKYMNGTAVMSMSNLLNAIAASDYEPNNAVSEAMKNFKNKYQKLAVNVGEGTKKVPGKNIYFIEGDKVIKNGQYKKPFTFIQTNPNSTITIEGNSDLNMMVLTEGKIRFKGVDTCNKRQVVKGIFYAGQGLSRDLVQKNTSLSNNQWCTEGGLTVKGVLIGKGLQGMMDNSRSNLNGWFETSDKKGTVMNGASVLIEYSPSVFTKSTMPPGAEDFTTALSIYKN